MKRRDFIKYGAALAGFGGACLICRDYKSFMGQTADIKNTFDIRPCRVPFEYMVIYNHGNIYPCCPEYLKYNISPGNIEKQDLSEIWNGKLFNDLRQRVLNGDFSMCNRDVCAMYIPCSKEDISPDYKNGPKEIQISYDYECNYNCITCRDTVKINTPHETELYDNTYIPKIIKLAKNTEVITISLLGDPLYSKHSRKLIKSLVKEYPDIKFKLHTNGLLLNEKNLEELNISDNIKIVSVSLDATNSETYKKILRTDAFDTVMKNLELMAEWKKQGKIDNLILNFVVHIMNYKEMPAFAKIAQKLDAAAFFSGYRPWPSAEYHKRYDEVAVFEPTNKHYKELVKILHNPVFKDKKHCYLEKRLADIANS